MNSQPAAWTAQQLRDDSAWVQHLSPEAIAGFLLALRHASRENKPFLAMTSEDFPLGAAAKAEMARAYAACQGRWGLCLVKGLPVDQWTAEEARLACWGMGLHFGVARTQSRLSSLMSDVRDEGGAYKVKNGRGYDTNSELDFHTDACDVIGLMCLKQARSGGDTLVTSSMAVVDEFARQRPDLLTVLKQPWHFSHQGTQSPRQPPHYQLPLLGSHPKYFAFRTNRKNIDAAQRDFGPAEIPRITQDQLEAHALLDALMPDARFCYPMRLEPGDLQLVNNYVILHSRTAFEDYEEPDRKRHLLRLWLDVPQAQPLPEEWSEYFADVRGGTVRSGLRGSAITREFLEFERRQAARMGMPVAARFAEDWDHLAEPAPAQA